MTVESKIASRRSFLKAGALSMPAIVGLSALVKAEAQKEGKIGVALCGLGGFSRVSIAPELPFAKNVYFAGVITGHPETKGREFAKQYGFPEKNIYTYEQMPRLADNKEIVVVHVVTPNSIHPQNAIAAAQAGKHVISEKPMATRSTDCEAMVEAARKAGVRLGVNYRLHFEPHHMEMIRLSKEKVYGNMKSITGEFSWNRGNAKPWLLDKEMVGGGAAFDTGVYPIQAGCYLTGETPIWASAVPSKTRDVYPAGIEETMSYTLEYPSGAVMQARASYAYNGHLLAVYAEKGLYQCVAPPTGGSTFGQSGDGKPNPKEVILPDGSIYKRPDTLQLAVLHDEFAAALKENRPFACPGEMGVRDIKIVEALYRSVARNGERVKVDAGPDMGS